MLWFIALNRLQVTPARLCLRGCVYVCVYLCVCVCGPAYPYDVRRQAAAAGLSCRLFSLKLGRVQFNLIFGFSFVQAATAAAFPELFST